MIPALLAVPMVQGVVGGVVGGVTNAFAPPAPPHFRPPPAFSPYLDRIATACRSLRDHVLPSGMLRSDEWNQMNTTDVQTWANSLAGQHVDATDASGRTISGLVSGMQQLGHTLALEYRRPSRFPLTTQTNQLVALGGLTRTKIMSNTITSINASTPALATRRLPRTVTRRSRRRIF